MNRRPRSLPFKANTVGQVVDVTCPTVKGRTCEWLAWSHSFAAKSSMDRRICCDQPGRGSRHAHGRGMDNRKINLPRLSLTIQQKADHENNKDG